MRALLLFMQYRRSLDIVIVAISLLGVIATSGSERVWWSLATLLAIALYYADVHRIVLNMTFKNISGLGK